jgi:acetylornithine deacetylase/succinyl-diaminopimelate desuccinylase-like protein
MIDAKSYDLYLEKNLDQSIAELSHFCKQPSVAAQDWGLTECAALAAEMLKSRGFFVEIYTTGGAPVVYAKRAGRSIKHCFFIIIMTCNHPSR